MNTFKTYDELNERLEALADEIPEKKAAKEAAATKKRKLITLLSGKPCTPACPRML